MRPIPLAVLLFSVLALAAGLVGTAFGQAKHAVLIEVDVPINSATEGFVKRAFANAEKGGAELVIALLDTPGGELGATREIVEVLLSSPVPSVVYVAPRGARAGSAGTFITAAANFAVMAPGTNIGAATPVAGGGQDLPETLASKVTNDAAALLRAIADERGRNAEKLEETVRQAASFSAQEAVELNVVDFIAADLPDLLSQLHGRVASTPAGEKTLDTQNLEVRRTGFNALERLLLFLADPNISFLLLSLGGLGLVIELLNPGLVAPGVVGAILLLLAFLALGNLPVNWAGVAFILLAFLLFVVETQVAGFGVLGFGAIVSFVVGGFLLFFHFGPASPTGPSAGVSLGVLIPTAAVLAGGGAWVLWTMLSSRRAIPATVVSRLVGTTGRAVTDLSPRGVVQVGSEEWSAVSDGDRLIQMGGAVRVIAVEGAFLRVVQAEGQGPDTEVPRAEGPSQGQR